MGFFRVFGRAKIAVTILKGIPHFFFLSLVTVALFYRSIESVISLAKSSTKLKLLVNEDFIFFSKYDIVHVNNVLNSRPDDASSENDEKKQEEDQECCQSGCCGKKEKKGR